MSEQQFNGVEDTLYIPLAARIEGSKRFPYYFSDEKALKLQKLSQVKSINKKSNEYTMVASVSRYYVMDKIVSEFLNKHKDGIIVNLGVGLETMNYRLESTDATFYQLDFPSVIKSREIILGKTKNEVFLPYDILDYDWTNFVPKDKNILLVASGVFQYFKPKIVSDFIDEIKHKFNNVELLFDTTNSVGISYAEKYVKKTGNTTARMYFYIDDEKEFCNKENIELLSARTFFTEARKQLKKLKLYTRIAMWVVDNTNRARIFHVKIK